MRRPLWPLPLYMSTHAGREEQQAMKEAPRIDATSVLSSNMNSASRTETGEETSDEADPAVIDAAVIDATPLKPAFHLGGQALIEGVMMRSPHYVAAAVRRADGTIETRVEPFHSILGRNRWMQLPLIRGSIALVEMMVLGSKFLNWSGQVALQDDDATSNAASSNAAPQPSDTSSSDTSQPFHP